MRCPKCNCENIHVITEQVSCKTEKKGPGCLWSLGRFILIIMTCGIWLIFGKRKGTTKTTFSFRTVGICQNCGNKFNI